MKNYKRHESSTLAALLKGQSEHTLMLFYHFVNELEKVGPITFHPAKTMIGIANSHKRIVYITQLGKNFIHAVFPFKEHYKYNFCFIRVAQVPGGLQFNHHFRMLQKEDVNAELIEFMRMAYNS